MHILLCFTAVHVSFPSSPCPTSLGDPLEELPAFSVPSLHWVLSIFFLSLKHFDQDRFLFPSSWTWFMYILPQVSFKSPSQELLRSLSGLLCDDFFPQVKYLHWHFNNELGDFFGSPVVDSAVSLQGAWIWFLVGELRSHIPYRGAKKSCMQT